MEEAKYSVSIPLPKGDKFDASATLTMRAEHSEELKNTISAVLGDGAFERIIAGAVKTTLGPTTAPSPTATTAPPPAATAAPAAAAASGACPVCGVGQLVQKNRKDGSGTFVACNQFPSCRYIKN